MENFSFEPEIVVDPILQDLDDIHEFIGNLANEWLIKIRYNAKSKKAKKAPFFRTDGTFVQNLAPFQTSFTSF